MIRTTIWLKDQKVNAKRGNALNSDLLAQDDGERISVLQAITDNLSLIFAKTISALSQDSEKSLQKSSRLYINHHFPSFSEDMLSVLKHITGMMFQIHSNSQPDQSLDLLKSKYINNGVPVDDVIRAIESLKEVTLDVLASNEKLVDSLSDSNPALIESESVETISEIKKKYPHRWVTVEVVELEKGFPKAGKVILTGKNRNRIAEEISKSYRSITTYTFYCGDLDEEVSPIKIRISKYLEPYFNFVIEELRESV